MIEWISPWEYELCDSEKDILERYLLRTLATGSSVRSNGFIDVFGISYSIEAEDYINRLFEGLPVHAFFEHSSELNSWIEKNRDVFDKDIEFYACTRGAPSALTKRVDSLCEVTDLATKNKEATKQVKRRFFELDAIYRHIRNALAHGQYKILPEKERFIFFDLSQGEDVSAIGCLSLSRMEKWYKDSCNQARKKL